MASIWSEDHVKNTIYGQDTEFFFLFLVSEQYLLGSHIFTDHFLGKHLISEQINYRKYLYDSEGTSKFLNEETSSLCL